MNYPKIQACEKILTKEFPFLGPQIERAYLEFGRSWAESFEAMLERMFPDEPSMWASVRAYGEFAVHGMRLMKEFEKTRQYVVAQYQDIEKDVYQNFEFMTQKYLPGMILSHFLWPHHYRQTTYFKNRFISQMKHSDEVRFVEIGLGSGFYSRLVLSHVDRAKGLGVDVSDASIAFTMKHLKLYDLHTRYQSLKHNVIDKPLGQTFDYVVSVELLEHLENPLALLKEIRTMLKPGAKAFITAALNAPERDHIYLYENVESVLRQIESAGLALEEYLYSPAYPSRNGLPVPGLASFIVYWV